MLTGYLHPDYAMSHSEFGKPISLRTSGGWLLKRKIEGTGLSDAMGPYPLFCCTNWQALPHDIEDLRDELVSILLVSDPFGEYSPDWLRVCFDHVYPFKDHYVIETGRPLSAFVNPSHRKHALRALREVDVEVCVEPLMFIEDWDRLFNLLAERHSIKGLRRFSRAAFEKQLAVPGLVMFRAIAEQRTIGLDLWYEQGNCAQGHLAAFDLVGYELRASYATKWRAAEYFSDRVKWIDLGAGAGIGVDSNSGLSAFKRGWSTGTKPTWLCGRVLQAEIYAHLALDRGICGNSYFPSYRRGEFA